MAISSYGGFDGVPITEPQFGVSVSDWATQMGVVGAGDWKVTAGANPGQLNIAPGTGWGFGVTTVSDSITSVTQGSLPSGAGATRWDLVAMRRDWQPPGGTCSFVIVQGSATKQLPAAAAAPGSSGRQVFPGVVHDQPLFLVQWTAGNTQPTAWVDLRCWGGNGGMIAKDSLALGYLGRIGARVTIGGVQWQYVLGDNDTPAWKDMGALESTVAKTADSPQREFEGLVEAYAGTDANGYGEFRFGQKGLPVFAGIQSVQLTPFHPQEAYMFTVLVQSLDTTKIRFRARRMDNSGWANGYGSISCFVRVVGW